MDIEHHNQKLQMDGKLHLCPLDDPKQILDLGTGSGIWCMEMADEYPECQFIGTDLSPVQYAWVRFYTFGMETHLRRDPPGCRPIVNLRWMTLTKNGMDVLWIDPGRIIS
jgi:hypothetical protein